MEEPISTEGLLREHLAVSAQVKSLNDLANSLFSMINLKESSEYLPEQLLELDQMHLNLNQLCMSLEESLKKHYASEDTFLRLYLGPYMLQAIAKEVAAIMEHFNRIKSLLASADIKGINREDSMVKSLTVKQAVESLNQQIDAHNQKVDSVLTLLKSVIGPEK